MYPVSNDYLNEIVNNNPTTRITGTLTLKGGASIPITNSTIAKAPTIMNQCVNKTELKLGQAYQAQCNVSIYSDINRYLIYNASLVLYFGLKIGNTWEDIPLGVFIVSECIRTSNDVLQITALDRMNKLDDDYTGDQISGTAYSILNYIASQHGLILAQNQNEIEALPNGTYIYGMPEKYRSKTWRDVVGDLAACLAGNALIDRNGKLLIQSFSKTVTRTLPASMRSKEKISDYLVSYSSASCVKDNMLLSVGTDSAQDISLDNNDFVQLGTSDKTHNILTNILEAIGSIEYTPSDISWFGDPALDLGDLIEATGGAAGVSTIIPVQKFKWTWRGNHQIVSVGKNPNLGEAKSLTDKKIEDLTRNTSSNETTFYNFVNLDAITFSSEHETEIAKLAFTSAQKTTVKILHEFIFDMLSDLSVECSYELLYYLDGELVSYSPYEHVRGIQGVSTGATEFSITRDFFYILKDVVPNVRHTWRVAVVTHGISRTTIDVNHAHVTLEGQRLYGDEYFDGYLEAKDYLTVVPLGCLGVISISDEAVINLDITATPIEASDNFVLCDIAEMQLIPIADTCAVYMERLKLKRITENGMVRVTEDGVRRISD